MTGPTRVRPSPFATQVSPGLAWVLVALLGMPAHGGGQEPVGEPETASVGGVILDARTGLPVRGARVEIDGHPEVASTRSNGSFELLDVEAGRRELRIRIGERRTAPQAVDLPANRHTELRVVLTLPEDAPGQPIELPPLEVRIERNDHPSKMRRFYQRARAGRGSFITREDIELRNPGEISDMLREIPGIRVTRVRAGLQVISSNRGCRLSIFLDGLPVPGLTVDEIAPGAVEGIELYGSSIDTPPAFRARSSCGALVIWTRDPGRAPG